MKRGGRIPWLALGLLGSGLLLWGGVRTLGALHITLPACPMKTCLGIPCATCGITRCAMACFEGQWAEAFRWHPVAVMLGMASPLAMGWDLQRAWRGAPYPSLSDSLAVRLGVSGLLAGIWMLQIVRGI